MNIVIIPARIGSKRIIEKNIKKFNGRPIIDYTIKLLVKMNLFDKIIVSTDSDKIIKYLNKFRKLKTFETYLRSKQLSGDMVGTRDVIVDILKKFKFKKNDNIFCVYPTSVFLKKKYIIKSLKLVKNRKNRYIFSAKEIDRNFFRSFTYEKNKLNLLFTKNYKKRTQDFKKIFLDAAQFYLAKNNIWLKNHKIFSSNANIAIIEKYDSIDIEEIADWSFAEKLYNIINK